jgi:hypothetical protein
MSDHFEYINKQTRSTIATCNALKHIDCLYQAHFTEQLIEKNIDEYKGKYVLFQL